MNSDYYPPGFSLPSDINSCSNCNHAYPYDEAIECPKCDQEIVCPSCDYCSSCNALISELEACECGSGELTDSDCCSQCFDEEEPNEN